MPPSKDIVANLLTPRQMAICLLRSLRLPRGSEPVKTPRRLLLFLPTLAQYPLSPQCIPSSRTTSFNYNATLITS
jgi:hypothetical protein